MLRHILIQVLAIGVLASDCSTICVAQEWARFRGPNGSGISAATSVPVQFSEGDCNWKVALPGKGHSSPVIWGKRVFLTSAEEDKGKRHMLCLSAADGKTLWDRVEEFTAYRHHDLNTCASSTPAVDEKLVYFLWATPDGVIAEAWSHDGQQIWTRDLGKLAIQHGIGTSPVVVGNVLAFSVTQEQEGPEGFLIGLDKNTGQVLWKRPRSTNQSATYATPLVYVPKEGGPPELIFTSTAHGITSVNPKSGEINWELTGLFTLRCVASPILANGLIFQTAGVGAGGREAIAVKPASKARSVQSAVAYKLPRGPSYVPTPIAVGNRIFCWGDGGIVSCYKADTGDTVWQERVGGNFYGSPVCVNGKLYAMSTKGELAVVEASDQFKVLGRVDLGEPSHATPAVAEGVMYLRTLSHLVSVGGKKP